MENGYPVDIEMACLNAGYINMDDMTTSASMEIDGGAFGMDGLSFGADSENGMFDTVLIAIIFTLATAYAITHIVEKILKIRKEYFTS
jgi:hypothetical protein